MAPIIVGFAILAGAKFAMWFWRLFWVGNLLGFLFVLWLFSQSLHGGVGWNDSDFYYIDFV
jgi:formate/nitrite transporter FocA (FNT family)